MSAQVSDWFWLFGEPEMRLCRSLRHELHQNTSVSETHRHHHNLQWRNRSGAGRVTSCFRLHLVFGPRFESHRGGSKGPPPQLFKCKVSPAKYLCHPLSFRHKNLARRWLHHRPAPQTCTTTESNAEVFLNVWIGLWKNFLNKDWTMFCFLQGFSVAVSPVLAIVGKPSVCLSVRHTLALSENDAS